MMVKVLEVKRLGKPGNLKAFVKLLVEDMIFHDFRIVQQSGQKPWVCPPQAEWKDHEGKRHFKPLIELPKALKDQITEVVLAAWGN